MRAIQCHESQRLGLFSKCCLKQHKFLGPWTSQSRLQGQNSKASIAQSLSCIRDTPGPHLPPTQLCTFYNASLPFLLLPATVCSMTVRVTGGWVTALNTSLQLLSLPVQAASARHPPGLWHRLLLTFENLAFFVALCVLPQPQLRTHWPCFVLAGILFPFTSSGEFYNEDLWNQRCEKKSGGCPSCWDKCYCQNSAREG